MGIQLGRVVLAVGLGLLYYGCSSEAKKEVADATTDRKEAEVVPDVSTPRESVAEALADETGAPAPAWPQCPGEESTPSLVEKAAHYDDLARNLHVHDGLLRTVTLTEPGSGEAAYHHHSDNANYWTGLYLASQIFRYAATGEPEALENALTAAEGLHHIQGVTGVPGLMARCYASPEGLYNNKGEGDPKWYDSTAPGYEGWRFKADVSKDGMSGVMFAYGVAAALGDVAPEVRDAVAPDAAAVAHNLMDNDLLVIDVTGERTEHGDLFAFSSGGFPGFNALLVSSFFKAAAELSGEQEIADYYYGCLMGGFEVDPCRGRDGPVKSPYVELMDEMMGLYLENCQENFNNFLMAFFSMHTLVRLETEPELLDAYTEVYRSKMWTWPGHEYPASEQMNPVYAFLYAGAADADPADQELALSVEQAVCNLKRFPASKGGIETPAGDPDLEVCKSRGGHPRAADPFPVDERYIDNCVWRLDPYEIPKGSAAGDGTLVWSPEDYLLPYWAGRYFGHISPES